ncbi:MAG: type II secretion system protein [Actinomycetota bacterium]
MATGSPRDREAGFSYLGVLFLVVILGLGLAGAAQSWSVASQRLRERELLWVGTQYARALQSYYAASPGLRQYPRRLEDLVEDTRFPVTRRHLRRLYPDPVTRNTRWGLVTTPDGRIAGVYSLSQEAPWKRAGFPLRWENFSGRGKYSDWKFVADDSPQGNNPLGISAPAANQQPLR